MKDGAAQAEAGAMDGGLTDEDCNGVLQAGVDHQSNAGGTFTAQVSNRKDTEAQREEEVAVAVAIAAVVAVISDAAATIRVYPHRIESQMLWPHHQ